MKDIVFPGNETELADEAKRKNVHYDFAYYDISQKNVVLTDQMIKKIGLNRLPKNKQLIVYDGKYSSEFLIPLVKRGIVDIVFGLEWNSDKDGYKSPATKLTPEVVQAMKQKDVAYGFCISDIADELVQKSNKLLPRLKLNASLVKKNVVFSGKRIYSPAEKQTIQNIYNNI